MHEKKVVIVYFSATSNTKLIVDECSRIFNNYKIDIDKCIACEVCVKQCPMKNIEIVNGRVEFINKNNCLRCMKCISNCPRNAITLGNQTKGMDRYNKSFREKIFSNSG